MENRLRSEAEPPHVSGVRRNFRLNQNNVEHKQVNRIQVSGVQAKKFNSSIEGELPCES
jgi:hypothetical protein